MRSIVMRDWTLPDATVVAVGWTGDHLSRRLEVLAEDLGPDWQLKLDVAQDEKGVRNVIDLTRMGSLFYADLTRDMLTTSGQLRCQLRGLSGQKVSHSNLFVLTVGESINAIDHVPTLTPSEMAQFEQRMTQCKTEMERVRDEVAAMLWTVKDIVHRRADVLVGSRTIHIEPEGAYDTPFDISYIAAGDTLTLTWPDGKSFAVVCDERLD